jgi:hypothetical protein
VSVVYFTADGQLKYLRYTKGCSEAEAGAMRRQVKNGARYFLASGTEPDNSTSIYWCANFPSAIEHRL